MLELVEHSLARCNKYGHDQIQFNNALAQSCLQWDEPFELLNNGEMSYIGGEVD